MNTDDEDDGFQESDFQENDLQESGFDEENMIEVEIDPELWLQVLLAKSGDEREKAAFIQEITQISGVAPEKIEEIMRIMIRYFMEITRSN